MTFDPFSMLKKPVSSMNENDIRDLTNRDLPSSNNTFQSVFINDNFKDMFNNAEIEMTVEEEED